MTADGRHLSYILNDRSYLLLLSRFKCFNIKLLDLRDTKRTEVRTSKESNIWGTKPIYGVFNKKVYIIKKSLTPQDIGVMFK